MVMSKTAVPRIWYLLPLTALVVVLLFSVGAGNISATNSPSSNLPANQDSGNLIKVIAPRGVLATAPEGVSLWHDYGSFALYRTTSEALDALPAAIRAQLVVAGETERLWFDSGPIEVETAAQPVAMAALSTTTTTEVAAGNTGEILHLVQFVGPIKDEWLQEVEATGAKLVQYIATNGYLLWADGLSRSLLDEMAAEGEFLQFSGPLPPAVKIGPALSARLSAGGDLDEPVPVVVQMVSHKLQEESEQTIAGLARSQDSSWAPVLKFQNGNFTVRLGDVETIAGLPDVYWVEERLERELLDEVQGQIVAGNFNAGQSGPASPGYLAWLASYGFSTNPADYPVVDVTDDGIGNGTVNSGDYTLHEFGDINNPTRLSYVANCTGAADGGGPDGHGHINVSIAGGYDVTSGFPYRDPLGFQRGLGISPFGRFAGTRVFGPSFNLSNCGGTDAGLIQSIQDHGAQISSNSWGCSGCRGTYDDSSQAFDAGTRDADPTEAGNQQMIFVFAAGNSGPGSATVGTPGNGKNMITVGASENQRPSDEDGSWTDGCGIGPTGADNAMDVISFSSRGPSPGSRVKPEVIAPGTHIQGTASTNASYDGSSVCDQYRPSGQTIFASSSGTSHSTPAVAGVTSLAYYWMENTYALPAPSAAVMKAYLIAHPTYLTGVSANDTLPSNNQGYGMPNMSAMFDDAAKYLLDQTVIFDNSGETWTWEGAAADPSRPVRIVLAYTDAPGAIGTSPQVNDLNLAADVDGTLYLGNVFSGQWSISGGAADPFNNYEAIFLPAGTSGPIQITVTGFNIAGDGVPNSGDGTDQDFALVCYNCAQTPTFSMDVSPASLDVCAPSDAVYTINVNSILGYSDPVALSATGNPAGTTASFSANPVTPPGSTVLTIGNTGGATAGSYELTITGDSTAGTRQRFVDLNLYTAVPAAPGLMAPADGAVTVSFKPEFSWTAVAQAKSYLLEVASDPGFTNIVYSASTAGTSHKAANPLLANTTYYWRVTADNVCGSATSATFSFTTQEATMLCNGATVEFEDGIPADWDVVDNTGGTGIVWVTTADPACEIPNRTTGTGEAACADSDAAGFPAVPYDTELISNPFTLSGYGSAAIDVRGYYRDITTNGNDRFEVDVWNGSSWTNELSWDEDHEPEDFRVNLSAYAGVPTVQVRFRYFGNGFDWYAQVDDVTLTCGAVSDPVIEVAPTSLTGSQGPDIITSQTLEITNTGGSALDWTIAETETTCDAPVDVPWLSAAPNSGTTIPLDTAPVDVTFDTTAMIPGDYSATLCVSSNDPATPVVTVPVSLTVQTPELLVCNGPAMAFETGVPAGWAVVDNTGGTGIIWTTTADPACAIENRTNGSGEAACADSRAAGTPSTPYDTELWTPLIDLSGWGAAVLDVKAYYRDITTNSNDIFEVDVWNGSVWTTELSWNEDHEPEDFSLNLSGYAGLPETRIRFRYAGNGYDYYAQVDDVALTCVEPGPPVIAVDPPSFTAEQGPDVVTSQPLTISNSGGSPLNWTITETDTTCATPGDVPWLSAAPGAGSTIPLGDSSTEIGFDTEGMAPGDYSASLCLNSDDPVRPVVEVPVSLRVLPPQLLLCNGEAIAFEAGIPPGWAVVDNTGGTGIVWTTTADPACEIPNRTNGSGEAACADSDAAGTPSTPYDTELWTPYVDLSLWGAAVLDVKAYYRDITTNSNDRFEVDVWDGSAWNNELTWDEDHEPEDFRLNLSAYAGLPNARLRFRYSGNGFDWYAQMDDIALTCVAAGPPAAAVDPTSLAAEQGPDVTRSQFLSVANNGGSPLDWTIGEASTDCNAQADVPWLSVSPDAGSTLPLYSDTVEVFFDTTGMAPGDYSASLCLNSDDPATPTLPVPVTLTVLPPFVLTCNGPIADFNYGIPSGWQVTDGTGNGVVWTDMVSSGEGENYTGGTGDAATASSDETGNFAYDTEMRTYAFDLGDWLATDTITLNYLANFQNFASRDYLDLDVSADGGATWTTLLSWNEDHGRFRNPPGEAVAIDLSSYAGMSGLKLRWRYYDPVRHLNWYAQVDDAGLACVNNPVIGVEPESLLQNQIPDVVESQELSVSNLGSADLEWSVAEGTCAAPEDYTWLSAAPTGGTTLPGESAIVSVSFDTAGLAPTESYNGTLCVSSNDPATPEVEVPVTLNVIYDFSGFIGSIKNPPEINSVKVPSVVPIIFSLAGDFGLDILADGYPASQEIDCTTLAPVGPLESTTPPGSSALRYDPELDRYTYPWQTQRRWANSCRQLVVELNDGMTYVAYFELSR